MKLMNTKYREASFKEPTDSHGHSTGTGKRCPLAVVNTFKTQRVLGACLRGWRSRKLLLSDSVLGDIPTENANGYT